MLLYHYENSIFAVKSATQSLLGFYCQFAVRLQEYIWICYQNICYQQILMCMKLAPPFCKKIKFMLNCVRFVLHCATTINEITQKNKALN